jgi:prepilin peptidase CpaA
MMFSVPPLFSRPFLGVEIVLLALVIAAAIYDVRYRRIPNWLTLSGILLGLLLNAWLVDEGRPWLGLIFSLKGLGLGFGFYFFLYMLHAMGAGDVKLMAAVGALVGAENWFGIFILTAILGGITGGILVLVRKRVKHTLFNMSFIVSELKSGRSAHLGKEELDVKSSKALRQPHGAIIALGTIVFLGLAAHYAQ